MNRSETILFNEPLRDKDGILKVVTIPGHERDQHVLAKRKFAQAGRSAICKHIATGNFIAAVHQGTLVHASVLVGTRVLRQVVNIDTRLSNSSLIIVNAHDYTPGIHRVDHTATFRNYRHTRVNGDPSFHTGTHKRGISTQRRHCLALHVRTHECAVSIIMLKEWH